MHKGKSSPAPETSSARVQASDDVAAKKDLGPSRRADISGGLETQTPESTEVSPRPSADPERFDESSSLDRTVLLSALSTPVSKPSSRRPSPVNTVRVKRVKGHWIAYTAHSERYEKTFAGLGATPGEAVCELPSHLDTEMPLARMAEIERGSRLASPTPAVEAVESEDDEPLFLEEQLRQEGALVIPENRRRRPS